MLERRLAVLKGILDSEEVYLTELETLLMVTFTHRPLLLWFAAEAVSEATSALSSHFLFLEIKHKLLSVIWHQSRSTKLLHIVTLWSNPSCKSRKTLLI